MRYKDRVDTPLYCGTVRGSETLRAFSNRARARLASQPLGDQAVGTGEVDVVHARRLTRQLVEDLLLDGASLLRIFIGDRVEHDHRVAGDEAAGVPLLEA